jgi:hypothetical protein
MWPCHGRFKSLGDYSDLLNGAIVDAYFVSTKSRDHDVGDDNLSSQINQRLKLLKSIPLADDENLARVLLINAPLKVNSKSSIPWQCVLSSAKNDHGDVLFPRFYPEYYGNS